GVDDHGAAPDERPDRRAAVLHLRHDGGLARRCDERLPLGDGERVARVATAAAQSAHGGRGGHPRVHDALHHQSPGPRHVRVRDDDGRGDAGLAGAGVPVAGRAEGGAPGLHGPDHPRGAGPPPHRGPVLTMIAGIPGWEALPASTIPPGSTGSLLYYSTTNTLGPIAPRPNNKDLTPPGRLPAR